MNLSKVSHNVMHHQKDMFHRPSVSDHNSDMYKWSSLSLNESLKAYHKGPTTLSTGKFRQYHQVPDATLPQENPFSLILPESTDSVFESPDSELIEEENDVESSHEVLGSGMILLKNYLSTSDQVEIVNKCQELGVGPGGFYQPSFSSGAKMQLHMMCYGRNWDPQSMSYRRYRIGDGAEAPPVPDTFISLVETTLQKSRSLLKKKDEFPLMSPDICIVNFYSTTGRLGLHQDMDESRDSLKRGLPVVSISIGDSAEFLYGYTKDKQKTTKVLLESGDILIFGGKNRHIHHGIQAIIPNSAPLPLLKETMLRPGRLNLTFRKY